MCNCSHPWETAIGCGRYGPQSEDEPRLTFAVSSNNKPSSLKIQPHHQHTSNISSCPGTEVILCKVVFAAHYLVNTSTYHGELIAPLDGYHYAMHISHRMPERAQQAETDKRRPSVVRYRPARCPILPLFLPATHGLPLKHPLAPLLSAMVPNVFLLFLCVGSGIDGRMGSPPQIRGGEPRWIGGSIVDLG